MNSSRQPGHDPRETVEDRSETLAEGPHHSLVLLYGRAHGGRRFALGSDPLELGREIEDAHHIQLDDPLVSRSHAELHWSEIHQRYWIRDLASRNGVHLNGIKVARELVSDGDVIRMGDTVFQLIADSGVRDACAQTQDVVIQPPFVGRSRSLQRSLERAVRIAACDAPVLILGPTGTGKELVAAEIHRVSRRTGPLVPVNCGALPSTLAESELFGHEKGAFSGADGSRAGLFRAAHAGTLFLDEVGELTPEIQSKLLRVLESRSIRPLGAVAEAVIDVRVVAATNRDLAEEVAHGRFRADLYARLTESVVTLDPLRDRPEDLEPLWRHFVIQLGQGATLELGGAVFEAMALHAWPFNVRELRQLVRSTLLRRPEGGKLTMEDLPPAMHHRRKISPTPNTAQHPAPPVLLADGEVPTPRQLRQLIEEFRGNVKDVAAFLNKDRKQIYRWLRRERIDPDIYRPESG